MHNQRHVPGLIPLVVIGAGWPLAASFLLTTVLTLAAAAWLVRVGESQPKGMAAEGEMAGDA